MIHLLGEAITQDNVRGSFEYVSRHQTSISDESLARFFDPKDAEFFTSAATKDADGYDFVQWVEEVFKR